MTFGLVIRVGISIDNSIRRSRGIFDTSEMYIGEVALYDKKVKFVGAVYDLRPQIPLFTFSKMIEEQGLMIDKIIPYSLDGQEEETDVNLQILKVQKDLTARIPP